jgi:hypothetical protein
MPRTDRFSERIGAVFLPESDTLEVDDDLTPTPEGPLPFPHPLPEPFPQPFPDPPPFPPFPPFKVCRTSLKQGCYTLSFVPPGKKIFGTRYRGTLRVENAATGPRISGDLYRYRLLDDIVVNPGSTVLDPALIRGMNVSDEAEDAAGIPIYSRRSYHSYLKGTKAQLRTFVPRGADCWFALEFDEFAYTHPASGFSGSFNTAPTRSLRCVFKKTSTPDLYTGEAFVGPTKVGNVSIRWVSEFYRRARLNIYTLNGAETPPSVGATTFATIWEDVGWELTVTDNGSIALPASLSGININACWSRPDLHTLMSSVPGYNPAELDSVWRVHLVAVPATLGCSRGVMFDSSLGADPNAVPREGSATFSRDGYPSSDTSNYDAAANGQQRNFPRAYLRSAAHEVGHAFNQIHQGLEGVEDNSIMTPTPSVADVLGVAGIFPDEVNLAFNDLVKKHLRHLPDPAVRPGAMDFFGGAVAAPEPADVAWVETAELSIELSSDRIVLGEPVELTFEMTNAGEVPLPVPASFDTESLTVRVNVTDPLGRITFIRPERVNSCPRLRTEELAPQSSISGSTTLFWGRDGFAFEFPGRHTVEVIALWNLAGQPLAAASEREVFVLYPTSSEDNEVAARMLTPEVGAAVAAGDPSGFAGAAEQIEAAASAAKGHPAVAALKALGLVEKPKARSRKRK